MAVEMARSNRTSHRHAAVLVKDGRVVAAALSRRVGPSASATAKSWRSAYVHAEQAALAAAGSAAAGATLYVARVGRGDAPAPSAPCARCEALRLRRRVRRVVTT